MDQDSKGVKNAGLLEGLQRMRSEKNAQCAYAEGMAACVPRIRNALSTLQPNDSGLINPAALLEVFSAIEKEARGVIAATSKDVEVLSKSIQTLSLGESRELIGELLGRVLQRIPADHGREHSGGLVNVAVEEAPPQIGDLEQFSTKEMKEPANG